MSAPSSVAADFSKLLEGIHLVTPEEAEAYRIANARPELVRLTRRLAARLGPRPSPVEFRRRAPHEALQALAVRYQPARGSVAIVGPAGTGKTETAKAMAWRLLGEAWKAGDLHHPIIRATWTSALELASELRATRLGVACHALREAQCAPILILDELGQESGDDRWLLELLDSRYSPRPLPTITTSGLTHAELVNRYGSGAVRRLTEPGGTLLDLFAGGNGGP